MRKSIQRRLEALEKEERNRQDQQDASLDPLRRAIFFIKIVVLAYYVGRLEPDEGPTSGWARALNYQSPRELIDALSKKDQQEVDKRTHAAFLRLYAQVGILAEMLSQSCIGSADLLPIGRGRPRNSRVFTQKAAVQPRAPALMREQGLFEQAKPDDTPTTS